MEGERGDANGGVDAGDVETIFDGDWETVEGAEGLTNASEMRVQLRGTGEG